MPNISESSLISFMPSVAWTLLCATNVGIPEWVHEDRAYRISELHKLLAKRDQRAIDRVNEAQPTCYARMGECGASRFSANPIALYKISANSLDPDRTSPLIYIQRANTSTPNKQKFGELNHVNRYNCGIGMGFPIADRSHCSSLD